MSKYFQFCILICFILILSNTTASLDIHNSSIIKNSSLLNFDGDFDNSNKLTTQGCYQIHNQSYKLVWNDEFDSPQSLDREWLLVHEEGDCTGNGNGNEDSCNVEQNVEIKDGFLVLAANYEKFYDRNYTAAKMTTKRYFTSGRYEIRAAQPIGRSIRTCIFTTNSDDNYWHESGQIDLICVKKSTSTYRGLYLANSTDDDNINVNGNYNNIHNFHLYGVEWDDRQIRFFFDDIYSEPVQFDKAKGRGLNPLHQIRFQIGVGGIHYSPLPSNFSQLYWKCPAFVIDYIRIFEHFETPNNETKNKFCINYNPLNYRTVNETLKHKNICKDVMDSSKYPDIQEVESKISIGTFTVPMLVVLVLVIFLVLTIFLCIQNTKLRRALRQEQGRLHELQKNYYNSPDYKNPQKTKDKLSKIDPYLDLHDIVPKADPYLDLHDVVPKSDPYLDLHDVVPKSDPYLDLHDVLPKEDLYLELQDALVSEHFSFKKSDKRKSDLNNNNKVSEQDYKNVSIKLKKSIYGALWENQDKFDQEKLKQGIAKVFLDAKNSLDYENKQPDLIPNQDC